MQSLLIENASLPDDDGKAELRSILIENGRISRLLAAGETADADIQFDAEGSAVVPGFIDVHIHGAVGVDVNDADAEGLAQIAEFLAGEGVTAWVPTLVPDSDANYRRTIGEIDHLMEMQAGRTIAKAVGVHYEGIFASEKMCGALRPEYFKCGSQWSVAGGRLPRLKKGVHVTTLAPEIDGGIELVAALVADGWIPFIGHTAADVPVLNAALAAGASHLTHFFNAMTGIHHRDTGVAGWGLTNDGVTFDIIADGIHVNPEMLAFACRSKSEDSVTLISDSVAPTGLGDGDYELWGETISVVNGRTRNERGSIAGSVISMGDAVKRMLSLGFTARHVSRMASHNPARLLGLEATHGTIAVGRAADLAVIDADGNVKGSVIDGRIVER